MTSPFPTQFNQQAIFDPGLNGGAIASGIAQVLAAMQQQKENALRQQQLAMQQAQAEALAQYYRDTVAVQNRQEDRLGAQAEAERARAREIGGAVRRALGPVPLGGGARPPQSPTGPVPLGGGAQPAPSPFGPVPLGGGTPEIGNATQAGPGLAGQALAVPSTSTVTPADTPQAPLGTSPTAGIFEQVFGEAARNLDPAYMQAVLEGVSAENIPAAVEAIQKAQPIPADSPEFPTSGKEFALYKRLQATDPEAAAEYRKLFLEKQPTTQINVGGDKAESAYSIETAKTRVATLAEMGKASNNVWTAFPRRVEQYKLTEKIFSGVGSNVELGVARWLARFGVKAAKDKVALTQQFTKLAGEGTLDYLRDRALGSGTAVSDGDREFTANLAGGNLGLDADAMRRFVRIDVGAGILRLEDEIAEARDQAQSYRQSSPDLQNRITKRLRQLGQVWTEYGKMLAKEGETWEQVVDRMSPDVRELYGARIQEAYMDANKGIVGEADKVPGVVPLGPQR